MRWEGRRRFLKLAAAGSVSATTSWVLRGQDPTRETVQPVRIDWLASIEIPKEIAAESVVFPRAYAVCPEPELARNAVWTGRYPHTIDGAPLTELPPDWPRTADAITILTAPNGNGEATYFDRSLHVPLAIHWPGRLAPRVASELMISHVDILPTLIGLLGQTPGQTELEGLQGRDLSGRILEQGGPLPDSVWAEGALGTEDEWRVVIRGYDKLVVQLKTLDDSRATGVEAVALYNLADDPGEEFNLLNNGDLERLRARREGEPPAPPAPAKPVTPSPLGNPANPAPGPEPLRNLAVLQRQSRILADSLLALARDWMRRTRDGMTSSGLRIRRPVLRIP